MTTVRKWEGKRSQAIERDSMIAELMLRCRSKSQVTDHVCEVVMEQASWNQSQGLKVEEQKEHFWLHLRFVSRNE